MLSEKFRLKGSLLSVNLGLQGKLGVRKFRTSRVDCCQKI